jgi:hypothetical protein
MAGLYARDYEEFRKRYLKESGPTMGHASKLVYKAEKAAQKVVNDLAGRIKQLLEHLGVPITSLNGYSELDPRAVIKAKFGESAVYPRPAPVTIMVYDTNDIDIVLPERLAHQVSVDEDNVKKFTTIDDAIAFLTHVHERIQS